MKEGAMRAYKLLVDLPFLKKGSIFHFYDESAKIFAVYNSIETEYSLRPGLSGYLWLLLTEKKYLKRLSNGKVENIEVRQLEKRGIKKLPDAVKNKS